MKLQVLVLLIAAVVIVQSGHTFVGTNVKQLLISHQSVKYGPKLFKKRVENLHYVIPQVPATVGKTIQGILAYDKTHTAASANITQGGIGFNFVNLRLKSERAEKLNYDIYIYA